MIFRSHSKVARCRGKGRMMITGARLCIVYCTFYTLYLSHSSSVVNKDVLLRGGKAIRPWNWIVATAFHSVHRWMGNGFSTQTDPKMVFRPRNCYVHCRYYMQYIYRQTDTHAVKGNWNSGDHRTWNWIARWLSGAMCLSDSMTSHSRNARVERRMPDAKAGLVHLCPQPASCMVSAAAAASVIGSLIINCSRSDE